MNSQPAPGPDASSAGSVALGCLLTPALHIAAIVLVAVVVIADLYLEISPFIEYLFGVFIVLFGLIQIAYMGRAIHYAYRRDRPKTARGLIVGAIVTFLLVAVFWWGLGLEDAANILVGRAVSHR